MLNRRELIKGMAVIPVCGILLNVGKPKFQSSKKDRYELVCLMNGYPRECVGTFNPCPLTALEERIIRNVGRKTTIFYYNESPMCVIFDGEGSVNFDMTFARRELSMMMRDQQLYADYVFEFDHKTPDVFRITKHRFSQYSSERYLSIKRILG
jgi:hypothetical protein